MKYLFLDIDEVLNSLTTCILLEHSLVDIDVNKFIGSRNVNILNILLKQVDLNIVISSTWRKIHTLDEIKSILYGNGLIECDIVGMTPNLNTIRGVEIEAYCNQHNITDYVILDDGSDMLPHQMDRFVKVSSITGLSLENVYHCIKILEPTNVFRYSLEQFFK